jgi:hypothetical protein
VQILQLQRMARYKHLHASTMHNASAVSEASWNTSFSETMILFFSRQHTILWYAVFEMQIIVHYHALV